VTRFLAFVTAAAFAFPALAAPSDVKMQVGRANDAARVQPRYFS
jgi:type IV secretion system protein VirB9